MYVNISIVRFQCGSSSIKRGRTRFINAWRKIICVVNVDFTVYEAHKCNNSCLYSFFNLPFAIVVWVGKLHLILDTDDDMWIK